MFNPPKSDESRRLTTIHMKTIIIFFLTCLTLSAQIKPESDLVTDISFDRSNGERIAEMAIYNAGFNALIGGIGAAMHKRDYERTIDAFLRGTYKGVTSSLVMSAGKTMSSLMFSEETYWYGWPAKLVNSAGASMLENTIQNKALFSNYGIDLVFMRIDINDKVQARIMPYHAGSFILTTILMKDSRLDIGKSLKTGALTFEITSNRYKNQFSATTYENVIYEHFDEFAPFDAAGYNLVNSYQTYSHETVHAFQDRDFMVLNSLYFPQKNKYIYWDVPVSGIAYKFFGLVNMNSDNYYSNPLEYEADYTSRSFRYGYAK